MTRYRVQGAEGSKSLAQPLRDLGKRVDVPGLGRAGELANQLAGGRFAGQRGRTGLGGTTRLARVRRHLRKPVLKGLTVVEGEGGAESRRSTATKTDVISWLAVVS